MEEKKVTLIEGDQVLKLFEEKTTFEQLQILYRESSYNTIFQSIEFIESWYRIKSSEYFPLALIYLEKNKISGSLFLAIPKDANGKIKRKKAKIIGAGEYDAEYQTWTVKKGKEKDFLPEAFDQIFKSFPSSKIIFRFIPDPEALDWLNNDSYWKKFSVIQPYRRPLLQMTHPDFQGVFKKRHLKAKYNRFSRAGKMELEVIAEKERFEFYFDEAMILYDFRQGALFNKIPSESNNQRKSLFLSLFEKGILHVSVLKLNGHLSSFIVGMKSEKWVHLAGMITYSPIYSKLSPGLVHIYLLGKQLESDSYDCFDLTPGDDGYKERMASNADEVFELTLSTDHGFKLKRKFRKKFHEYLLSKGIRPLTFNLKLHKFIYLFKSKLKSIKSKYIPGSIRANKFIFDSGYGMTIEKNKIEHLLAYDDQKGLTRWEFLSDAFQKVESGESFYSLLYKGQLLACIWTQTNYSSSKDEGMAQTTSTTLDQSGIYVHNQFLEKKDEFINLCKTRFNLSTK